MARIPSDIIVLRGPLFTKRIDKVVQGVIIDEAMGKFEERITRKGRKIGRKRNPIGPGDLTKGKTIQLTMTSSLHRPRTSGIKWTQHNVRAIKAMRGRVLRSVAKRIVGELS